MVKRLILDGNTGDMAILSSRGRYPFDHPESALDQVHFHSRLDYFAVVEKISIPVISFASVAATYYTYTSCDKGGFMKNDDCHTVSIPTPYSGSRQYLLGSLSSDTTSPIIGFFTFNGRRYQTSGACIKSSNSEWSAYASWRNIGISMSGNNVFLTEDYMGIGEPVPAQVITNVEIFKFKLMTDANPTSTKTLQITPTRFIASRGKLDSNLRYVRRTLNPDHYLTYGRTMDLANGGVRYMMPDGSHVDDNGYNGSFYSNHAVGISV